MALNHIYRMLGCTLLGLLTGACEVINPPEDIPSYLYIGTMSLMTDTTQEQGSASSRIEDAWVTVNRDYVGTFEVPETFPVLHSGQSDVLIRAGILENGINNTRIPYPFYTPIRLNRKLVEKQVDSIPPIVVEYIPQARFAWIEDFEDTNNVILEKRSESIFPDYVHAPEFAYGGNYSLKATLDEANELFEMSIREDLAMDLPQNKAVFLELNYRTDGRFVIGYIAESPNSADFVKQSKLIINPTGDTWKKIYVNLGFNVSSFRQDLVWRVFFGALKNNDGNPLHIYLDNLKLVYLE